MKSKTPNQNGTAQDALSRELAFVENLKRQWLAMIDALVDPITIIQADYTVSKANRAMADLASKPVKEIIGQKCFEVFAGRKQPCDGCQMARTFESKTSNHWELGQVRGDRFYEVTSQPVYNEQGNIDGVVQVYRDRTEAKKLQEQLLQSEKLASIGLLAGGIAHEINNPLGGIIIFSQMLIRELPPDTSHLRDAEEIFGAAQRCKQIVENLLDFARHKPIERKFEPENVNLQEAAQNALRFARVGMRSRDIEIVEDWRISAQVIKADKNKFIQVFLNLIQNAFQAMPDGGTLTLRSFVAAGMDGREEIVVEVEDTGVGIPEEHKNRILDPFFTTKDPGEGTGLGLAICYGIIDDFGGHLSFKSQVGIGTTFRVAFPRPSAAELTKSA
jgi:two-component system NtrC family sensor kinase